VESGPNWLRGPRIPFAPGYRFLLATEAISRILEVEKPDVIEVGSPFLVPKVLEWAQPSKRIPTVGFYHMPTSSGPTSSRMRPRGRRASAGRRESP
jgi:hypothetical protein